MRRGRSTHSTSSDALTTRMRWAEQTPPETNGRDSRSPSGTGSRSWRTGNSTRSEHRNGASVDVQVAAGCSPTRSPCLRHRPSPSAPPVASPAINQRSGSQVASRLKVTPLYMRTHPALTMSSAMAAYQSSSSAKPAPAVERSVSSSASKAATPHWPDQVGYPASRPCPAR